MAPFRVPRFFQSYNRYLAVALGEDLGYLFKAGAS
jgi:hypothetical protein